MPPGDQSEILTQYSQRRLEEAVPEPSNSVWGDWGTFAVPSYPEVRSGTATSLSRDDRAAELDSTYHGGGGYSDGCTICNTILSSTADADETLKLYVAQSSAAISQSLLAPAANAFSFDESDVAGNFAQGLPQCPDDIASPDSLQFANMANISSHHFGTALDIWHKSDSTIFSNPSSSHLHTRTGPEPSSDNPPSMELNISTPCIGHSAYPSTSAPPPPPPPTATRRKKDQFASRRLRATKRRSNRVTTIPRSITGRKVHGTKPYTCDIPGCGKTFTLEKDLKRHRVSSQLHPEFQDETWACKEVQCRSYNKAFSRQDNYQRHVRTMHSNLGQTG